MLLAALVVILNTLSINYYIMLFNKNVIATHKLHSKHSTQQKNRQDTVFIRSFQGPARQGVQLGPPDDFAKSENYRKT